MPRRPTPFGTATLVDAKEIAAFLACSPKHVRRLAEQGRMPKPVKVGRLCRWPRESIERWLQDRI
jgi:excisionase family DNA binding protein